MLRQCTLHACLLVLAVVPEGEGRAIAGGHVRGIETVLELIWLAPLAGDHDIVPWLIPTEQQKLSDVEPSHAAPVSCRAAYQKS